MLLLRMELIKTFRKLRSYIGFALILVLVPLVYWGLSYAGEDMVDGMTRGLQQNFVFVGSLFNGWFVATMVMNALYVHVPFLILLAAGDLLAGEATSGTYRIILSRPPSRARIFGAKVGAGVVYSFSLVYFLGALSTLLGLACFGGGDMATYGAEGLQVFRAGDVWWRFTLAYTLAGWGMCVVASLGLLFSSVVENAIGPIVGSFAVVVLCYVLGNLPFDFFEAMQPYLFTSYLNAWRGLFTDPVDWSAVLRDCGTLGLFFLVFTGGAWWIFSRKDVLS